MDTLTQMTLGAAVGELTLGKKVGNKAVLWGAVGGTIPDLDILANPFLDTTSQLVFHRGFSHSVTFALLFAPLFGYLIYRLYKGQAATWRDWSILGFWSVVTHPLLDCFTAYGTELFWPFSDYRVAFNTIFVIDPLYSVPFFLSVVALMFFHRSHSMRRILNYSGLALSTFYLAFTVVNKLYINSVFETGLKKQDIRFNRLLTAPTPLNNILWRGVAENEAGYWEGFYSLLDKNTNIRFRFYPKNHHLIEPLKQEQEIRDLVYFTKGFYAVTIKEGKLLLHDMRYGKIFGWMPQYDDFIFSFQINNHTGPEGRQIEIRRHRPEMKVDIILLKQLLSRIRSQSGDEGGPLN